MAEGAKAEIASIKATVKVVSKSVKVGDKTYLLVPDGFAPQKINLKNKVTEDEAKARTKAEEDLAKEKGKVNIGDYDVLTDSAIDVPAIRKKVIAQLGAKNTIRAVLLLNTHGFTGKANGTLKLMGEWDDKEGKPIKGEFNIYDHLKPIIVNGSLNMKADDVTTGRIVRVFADISLAHFKALGETVGPFKLIPNNSFNWYYGGIYACPTGYQQLGHFFGMAYALKNKTVPKMLPLDFPASYLARQPATINLLAKFIVLAEYTLDAPGDMDTFAESMTKFISIQSMTEDELKKVKDATIITYIMSLGEKWTQMLPVEVRKKFKKDLLSDAYAKSSFHINDIKKAMKAAKKAKGDNEEIAVINA